MWFNNPTSHIYPKIIEIGILKIGLYSHVHCSIIHDSQDKRTTQMSIDRWKDREMWYIHTKEYYLVLKKKETLPFVTTWMNLEDIMLSEISQ